VIAAYVYAAVRTPFGRLGGGLAQIRPDDLAATVLTGLLAKTPGLDPGAIDEVVWGNANGAGEENRNVGRMAVLLAGLPTSVPATTVNRLCGSSLDAAMIASRMVESGDADVAVAGGVESMTRAPWVLLKPARPFPPGNLEAVSTTLGWRLVNERMPAEWTVSLGEGNEQLREKCGISRERQDAFAARSHQLADAAWAAGFYDDLVMPVPGAELVRDETIRSGSTPETLAALSRCFGLTALSPLATPLRSTTAPPPCCWVPRRRRAASDRLPWRGSPAAVRTRWTRRCSGMRRWRRPSRRSAGPALAGLTWVRWS
jgi:acetyl-CoA acetyltransferase family protein